jgi:transcriptional regulator with XRE-family HTH domain
MHDNCCVQPVQIIKDLLSVRGITPTKMCKELGFSSGSFSQWMQGRSNLSLDTFSKIASYLQVSADYLLGRTCDPVLRSPPSGAPPPTEQELLIAEIAGALSELSMEKLKALREFLGTK